ncbi:hypothetical protein PoB_007334400 [Plakobranchus ocellatus]|uniref:Uncharacterized protein n=1 Tax=Plakobranchus ocellatus TaxID=259542 RepID=A0AAV4DRH9_9GAST|nr:hypothetical protein PoB_007334400 [Plakobranchus ocellatus]
MEVLIHGGNVPTIIKRYQVPSITPAIIPAAVICTKAHIARCKCPPRTARESFLLRNLFQFRHQPLLRCPDGHLRILVSLQRNASISAVTTIHFSSLDTTANSLEP